MKTKREIDILFFERPESTPAKHVLEFVEIESPPNTSIRFPFKWVDRGDGYVAMRFEAPDAPLEGGSYEDPGVPPGMGTRIDAAMTEPAEPDYEFKPWMVVWLRDPDSPEAYAAVPHHLRVILKKVRRWTDVDHYIGECIKRALKEGA